MSSQILFNFFNFYLGEIKFDISKLPVGCTLSFSNFIIVEYVDDSVLVAPTAQALQVLLNAPTSKLYIMSLQVNVQKSCSTALDTALKMC